MVRSKNSRGSALVIALVVVILIGGLSVAFVSMTYSQNKTTYNATQSETALNMAEAGVDDAINKLNALMQKAWKGDDATTKAALTPVPTSLGATYQIVPSLATSLDYYCVNVGTLTSAGLQTSYTGAVNRGTFDVLISPPFIGAGTYTITTHGYYGKEKKGLSVMLNPTTANSTDDYGLVGKVTLTATSSNVFVDSFKSSLGTYASQTHATTVNGTSYTVARTNGNLGSNGDIDVKNGIVFGSATPGPTSTVTIGNATITGATTPAQNALDIPSFDYSAQYTQTASQTSITDVATHNGMYTFGSSAGTPPPPTQTFHMTSLVTQGSGAGITINGPTVLFVDGDIGMNANEPLTFNGPYASLTIYQKSGNITLNGQTYTGVNATDKKASNLIIKSAGTGTVKFNGGSDVYANVYAPDASFTQTGTSTFYGKMVASTISIGGNMTFHRDEDVAQMASAPPVFKIKTINETNY
jgi:Tfp pilus assembly protein PilX